MAPSKVAPGDDIFDDPNELGKNEEEDQPRMQLRYSGTTMKALDEEEESDTGLTENQNRLLYIVSLYTHAAKTDEEKEEWIRKQALMVLIYEGVVAQVLDYDYAPASELVEMRRKYFNISQEGKSDVDHLREEELINGLKLSSKDYQPVTCFQISEKGEELLKRVGRADKEAVHELVYAPGTRELLRVEWDGEVYGLSSSSDICVRVL